MPDPAGPPLQALGSPALLPGATGPAGLLADVRRIAVLRANALGDFVATLPALHALKAAYPQAEIILLGTPMHVELLDGRRGPVDRVEVLPVTQGLREIDGMPEDPQAVDAFVARLRDEEIDLAVQMHGGGRWSNPFVRRLKARIALGLCAADAEPLDLGIPYVYYQHEILRFLELVALVGARSTVLTPALAVTDQDRAKAARALGRLGTERPIAVLHPGATDPRRHWPAQSFAQVGDALARAGAVVVVTGTHGERGLAHRVAGSMAQPATVLAGDLGLGALVGLLERAAVVVSNDTGPRHLAEAVGTATVSIYWCGNLINAGPLTRARHRAHISWRLECPVCGSNGMEDLYPARTGGTRCRHRESFVADVPVSEVLPDALELLGRERRALREPREPEPAT